MPTYHYRCAACGHEFEEFQTMTAASLDTCPKCSGKIERVISGGAGVIFKGGGFYQTDYRSEGYKKDAKADTGAAASSPSSASTGEAKNATSAGSTAPSSGSAPSGGTGDPKKSDSAKPAPASGSSSSSSAAPSSGSSSSSKSSSES